MKPIVTLTLNPSVDVAWEVDEMVPVRKLRAHSGRSDPGGGGINVSRVVRRLGGLTVAVYLAGGLAGEYLEKDLERIALPTRRIDIKGETRLCAMAYERASGQEFRIVPEGPELSEGEWQAALDAVAEIDAGWLVATGSLPPGVPADFYARTARVARGRGMKVLLDTSGTPLFQALEAGVDVVSPNLRELEHLVGRRATSAADQEEICRDLVARGKARMVGLKLGPEGGLLTWEGGQRRLASPNVPVKSTVGAGDSFVAGLVVGLAEGRPLEDAFALAVAAGTATVMTTGTRLCRREDVVRLHAEIRQGMA